MNQEKYIGMDDSSRLLGSKRRSRFSRLGMLPF